MIQSQNDTAGIQKSHDNILSVNDGYARNTDINLLVFHLHVEPSILRFTAFGDIQIRQDFDTGDDRRLKMFGRGLFFMKYPIHTETDGKTVLFGFDMDVGGIFSHRLHDHHVDQAHNRRLLSDPLEAFQFDLFPLLDPQFFLIEALDHLFHCSLNAIILIQGFPDLCLRGDRRLDGKTRFHSDFIQSENI